MGTVLQETLKEGATPAVIPDYLSITTWPFPPLPCLTESDLGT